MRHEDDGLSGQPRDLLNEVVYVAAAQYHLRQRLVPLKGLLKLRCPSRELVVDGVEPGHSGLVLRDRPGVFDDHGRVRGQGREQGHVLFPEVSLLPCAGEQSAKHLAAHL